VSEELLAAIRAVIREELATTMRAIVREETDRAAERLEARLLKRRIEGKRRHRAPELAAAIAAAVITPPANGGSPVQPDDVTRARAARTVARLRAKGAKG
jgi:hypothetical protein